MIIDPYSVDGPHPLTDPQLLDIYVFVFVFVSNFGIISGCFNYINSFPT